MSERPTPPEPELSEEEIRAQLEAAQARLLEQMEKGQQDLTRARGILEHDLTDVEIELNELNSRVKRLEPFKDHPEGGFHYRSAVAFQRAKAAEARMIEVQLDCLDHNFKLAQSGPPEAWDGTGSPFRDAASEPAYALARATMDYYLAAFYWLQRLEWVDTLLRAVGHEPAIAPHNPEDEATRAERAQALKARLTADKETQIAAMRLAEELNLAQATLPWAKTALARLEVMPRAEQQVLLADPDWMKLNGAMRTLEALPQSLAALPGLADFDFSTPEVQLEDPFDDIVLPGR